MVPSGPPDARGPQGPASGRADGHASPPQRSRRERSGSVDEPLALRVIDIDKSFPGVHALKSVSFEVRRGTVHALCGENGAGKSTLMKIIHGLYAPDSGEIFVRGERVTIDSPVQAQQLGIAMIAQELSYIPDLTVEENLFLGRLPTRFGRVDWKRVRKETEAILREEGLPYRPDTKLRSLTISDIQLLEITRAVHLDADIIIMDEPTSAIAQQDVENLFQRIDLLRSRGVSIVYISHKMDEVFRVADDITILRDGAVISTDLARDLTMDDVVSRMVGRKLDAQFPKHDLDAGDRVLEVRGLQSEGEFADIDLHVRAGEIVGLAGLIGAGRSEVVRAIFGLDPYDDGEILIDGAPVRISSPSRAIANGIAMLSEDRRNVGIVPELSVRKNATLATLRKVVFHGRAHNKLEAELVGAYVDRMRVKTPSLQTPMASLSGGNQQKVLLIRWLLTSPKILLLDEPTRGIDVGAKREIYALMTELASQGIGILMISSELPELIGMADRIYVMSQGRLTAELAPADYSQETILKHAMSGIN
jgi:inositol transport system ATP-binding protein